MLNYVPHNFGGRFMNHTFEPFEQGIARVSRRPPGMPRAMVILTALFFVTFGCVTDDLNRLLADHGVNPTTSLALAMIYGSTDNRVNPCELSAALNSSRTNVTRLIDELEKQGWVERNVSPSDRRRIDLSLTPSGVALVEQYLPRQWDHIRSLWDDFDAAERATLERLLRKLLTHVNAPQPDTDGASTPTHREHE